MLGENEGVAASGKRVADMQAGGGGGAYAQKRRRSDGPEGAFDELLGQAGCRLSSSCDGYEFEVEDPRKMRRLLEKKLTLNPDLSAGFLAGLQEQLGEVPALLAALKPMQVTGNAPITGDSFVRVLLNAAPLQAHVSQMLLERLPDFCDPQGKEAALPQLILGQFRWLDHVADAQALTDKLLEVLPVCPEELKKDAITFLPEVATEGNHQAVIGTLEEMMGQDSQFILPSIEALANLCLTPEEQSHVVEMVLERFQSAEAEDLPAVSRFLLQYAAPGAQVKKVVSTMRKDLHFVSPSDPRLAVPDRKQKGRVLGGADNPEHQLLEAVKQAMQLSPVAADAVVREIRGATEPEKHRVLDAWLLLVMLTLGADRRKAAEAILRRKFAEGHAPAGWLQKAIIGHEKVMLEFFPQLLSLAQQLLRNTVPPVQEAGMELFCCMFQHFSDSYNQQEVLRALHSHLGAQAAAESGAALQVLLHLSQQHTNTLGRYAAFLTNILDYIDSYSDQQVHKVFSVFSELVVGACYWADECGSGGEGVGRSRMEDELMIFVRKQLSSTQGQHRRIGIIGTVALVQRLGASVSDAQEPKSAIVKRYAEAMQALKDTVHSCRRSPEAFAFLCDELTRGIQRKAISRQLMDDVHTMLSTYLEETFCCFMEEGSQLAAADATVQVEGQRLQSELWWNLDGASTPVALRLLPLLAEELAPGSNSAPLLSLFATVRLMSALELELSQGLESVAALLGCPLNLFEMALASPQRFGSLPAEQRRGVLLGLWYALNWCRELVNCFGRQLRPNGQGDDSVQLKLFGRLRCCCQLEVLLEVLLQHAPPLFVLPPLANTLDSSPGNLATAAAAAVMHKKAGAKVSGKGDKGAAKKKAVKFEDNTSSGESGRRGGATSQRTHGGGSTLQTTSGSTQAGDPVAAHGVAVAVADGLGRLAAERWKQRSLLLPALATLGVGAQPGQEHPCYAMLPSAAYVLADLHSKLKAALAATRRTNFPLKAAKHQQLAADLGDLPAAELLRALAPVLPAMRRHFDAACNIIDQGMTEQDTEEHDRTNFWDVVVAGSTQLSGSGSGGSEATLGETVAACMAPMDNGCSLAALSPLAAASRVRTLALDCVWHLVQWPCLAEPANRSLLVAFLEAFSKDPAAAAAATAVGGEEEEQGAVSDVEIVQLIKDCFVNFSAPMPDLESDQPTTDSPSHQHACLLILDALLALMATVDTAPTEKSLRVRSKMSKRISRAAEAVLKQVMLDGEGKELGSLAWKGRGPLLADVLRLHLCHMGARSSSGGGGLVEKVLQLATTYLPQVTESTKGKEASESVDPFPSLSGTTLSIWYRVCLEQLQVAWDGMAAAAQGAEKHKAAMWDEEALEPILSGMKACASAFSALLAVVKHQTQRVAIHVQAVKSGGKFLLTFFKTLGFWAQLFPKEQEAFQTVVKDIQKATRVLQTLCSEGKYRKEMPLTAKVPVVKRTVERFVFCIKAFLTENNAGSAFWLGALKHRDLTGREMPSQMYTAQEDGEAEEEDDNYGEEEEMGETQADE